MKKEIIALPLVGQENVVLATEALLDAVVKGYYDLADLRYLNYSEICEWLDWPDLQDGGIYEQAIVQAADVVIGLLGYTPQHSK